MESCYTNRHSLTYIFTYLFTYLLVLLLTGKKKCVAMSNQILNVFTNLLELDSDEVSVYQITYLIDIKIAVWSRFTQINTLFRFLSKFIVCHFTVVLMHAYQ